jgi:hypothetical protein
VSIDDLLGILEHALVEDSLAGPVNAVGPEAVTGRTFARTMGGVLRRPSFVRTPRLALRLALGEMADEMVLASARVEPRRLLASGYAFRQPTLEEALRHVLGRERTQGGAAG